MEDKEIEGILKKAYTNQTTLKNYMHRLHYMRDSIMKGTNLYTIISKPDISYEYIRKEYPNISTRKNFITVILALFKHSEHLRRNLDEQQKRWKTFHDHMDSFQEAQYKKHMPDKKQISKYTSYEDIEQKYKELKKSNPHDTQQNSMQYVLLSIIISTPPKRSDYGQIAIYYDEDPQKEDINYIVINTNRPTFLVFNKYKTSKTYKRIDQELPPSTTKDIKDSLRRYDRKYLFINRYNKPYITNDGFSKYVVRVFTRLFGRNTGVTMLRHFYITERVSFDEMDEDERELISHTMMHSNKLQYKYNWSKKAICENLCRNIPSPSLKKSGDQ